MKTFLAAAAIAALPFAASAATENADIFADTPYSFGITMTAMDTDADFIFSVKEDLVIGGFALSGSGTNDGLDLGSITFGKTDMTVDTWTTISTSPFPGDTSANAVGFLTGATLSAGDVIAVYFNGTMIENPTSVTVSFSTTADNVPPPEVPLPAAGLLLGSVLVGGGLMSRKKKS